MSLTLRSLPLFIEPAGGTTLPGNTGTATAVANAGTTTVDVMGSLALASAEAFFGTQEVGVKINGSLATASAEAISGTLQILYGDFKFRSGYFQLRPMLEVTS